MIRALGGPVDDPILILGLSDENQMRLRLGEPITVRLDEMRPGTRVRTVVLVAGETEESIMDDLRASLGVDNVARPEYGPGPGQ
jgi:hypothetical protein